MTKQRLIIAGLIGAIFIGASLYGLALWSGGIGLKDNEGVHDSKYNDASSSAPTTVNGITYITRTYFPNDEAGEISIIEITAGLPKEIMDKVNKELRRPIRDSCWGDPEDKETLEKIRERYKTNYKYHKDQAGIAYAKDVDTMSYEEVRKLLINSFGYTDYPFEEISYIDKTVLSIQGGLRSSDCGGAHPEAYSYALNFDLSSGDTFEFKDFFKDYEMEKEKIGKIVYPYLQNKSDAPEECNYETDYNNKALSIDNLKAGFSKDGITVVDLGYIHANKNCDIHESITIPFSLLKRYLNTGAPFMKSVIFSSFYEDTTLTTTNTRGSVVKVDIKSCEAGKDDGWCFGSGRKLATSQGNLYVYDLVSVEGQMRFGVVLYTGDKDTDKGYLYTVTVTQDKGLLSESYEDYLHYKNFVLNYFTKKYLSKETVHTVGVNTIFYEDKRQELIKNGWAPLIPKGPHDGDSFPEITNCGQGYDIMCSVTFVKDKERHSYYVHQVGGRWVFDGGVNEI